MTWWKPSTWRKKPLPPEDERTREERHTAWKATQHPVDETCECITCRSGGRRK